MTHSAEPTSGTHTDQSSAATNLIAIASGKGGVGKTFMSTTLAHAFALSGRKSLLFDGDLGLANVDVQLGLMPEHDLGSVISGQATLDEAVCRVGNAGLGAAGRFDVIAGKSGSGALESLSLAELAGMGSGLRALSQAYDVVLVDLPAGLDRAVTYLSGICNTLIVVLTNEPTSLTDAYAYIKVIARQHPQAKFQVVVNRVTGKTEGRQVFESLSKACNNFLGFTPNYLGAVRDDLKVREAIRNQTPLLSRTPDARAGKDILALARDVGAGLKT